MWFGSEINFCFYTRTKHRQKKRQSENLHKHTRQITSAPLLAPPLPPIVLFYLHLPLVLVLPLHIVWTLTLLASYPSHLTSPSLPAQLPYQLNRMSSPCASSSHPQRTPYILSFVFFPSRAPQREMSFHQQPKRQTRKEEEEEEEENSPVYGMARTILINTVVSRRCPLEAIECRYRMHLCSYTCANKNRKRKPARHRLIFFPPLPSFLLATLIASLSLLGAVPLFHAPWHTLSLSLRRREERGRKIL